MPHHVYRTHALVTRSVPVGEADAAIELFTEEWGRVVAHARGVRRETSRLRYVLQPMSWATINIVRGSRGWRLTTARPDDSVRLSTRSRPALARVAKVLRRFVPIEVRAQESYRQLRALSEQMSARPESREDAEPLALAAILASLGYWGAPRPAPLGTAPLAKTDRIRIVSEINRILRTVPH